MLNQCNFIGNVGRDPEIRTMQNGDKVANLSIADSETWRDKQSGERKEKTTWVPVVVWGNLAGIVEQYVSKGSKIMVSGKFQVRKWQDQSGNDRYSTEIVLQGYDAKLILLSNRRDDGDEGGRSESGGGQGGGGRSDMDDEIPF
jgi:single-strand DNA-binding protein